MKKFRVSTTFIFTGDFIVTAENATQAHEYVEKHCGLVLGGNIHSTLPDELIDWQFNTHPDKKILKVKADK